MFLNQQEEKVLFRHYEKRLLDFCTMFKPVMPKSVVVINNYFYQLKMGPSSVPFWAFLHFKNCICFSGHSLYVFSKILFEQLFNGVSPSDDNVSVLSHKIMNY